LTATNEVVFPEGLAAVLAGAHRDMAGS
jgi:hypothetical protein